MKHRLLFAIALLIAFAGIPGLASSNGCDVTKSEFDKKIAAVNGVGITKRDFMWAFSSEEQRIITSGKPMSAEQTKELKQTIFDQLVNRELLYQESFKKKIIVSELKVEEEFKKVSYLMPQDIDLKSLKEEMDMDETHIKDEFRRVFAIEALIAQELPGDGSVTDTETRDFYDSHPEMFLVRGPVFARHILIKVEPDADEARKVDARKQLEAVYEKVKGGDDFAQLARHYSQGPSAPSGGIVGWVKPGRMVKAFEDAVFALDVGEISGIVETQYGFHIIKVVKKEPDQTFVYEEIQEKLADHLKKEKMTAKERAYVEQLRQEMRIELFTDIQTLE
jgi:peptidyl-prolyl cis-trans isomerase C